MTERRPAVLRMAVAAVAVAGACLAPSALAGDPIALPSPTLADTPVVQAQHGFAAHQNRLRWPGTRITYSDASRLPKTVREAVRLWNRATTSVRLVRAPAGRRGQIHITSANPCNQPCAYYPPDGRVFLPTRGRNVDQPDNELTLSLAVHELGHALGLPHVSTCSVMTPFVGFRECPPPPRFAYRCGPQRSDAQAIVRLYGGRVRTDGLCRLERPKPARATVLAPRGVLTAPAHDAPVTLTVRLRNTSAANWIRGGSHAPYLQFSDGRRGTLSYCGQFALKPRERVVRRGRVATFRVRICAPGYGPVTLAIPTVLILETEGGQSRSRPMVLRVAYPAAPEPEPIPEPLPEPEFFPEPLPEEPAPIV